VSKLKEVDVLAIRKRIAEGHSPTRIANEFGVSRGTVADVRPDFRRS
jgi:DNA-binding CsgD family transcriptional regulator